MSARVYLQKTTRTAKIPSLRKLHNWVNCTLQNCPKTLSLDNSEVGIRIVGKKTSAKINTAYRGKKGPTNVLSFTYPPIPLTTSTILGDLIMCAELIEKEARRNKKSLTAHWAHLTVHGILHLLGYDHVTHTQAKIMENLEIKILKKMGYANPYEKQNVA